MIDGGAVDRCQVTLSKTPSSKLLPLGLEAPGVTAPPTGAHGCARGPDGSSVSAVRPFRQNIPAFLHLNVSRKIGFWVNFSGDVSAILPKVVVDVSARSKTSTP